MTTIRASITTITWRAATCSGRAPCLTSVAALCLSSVFVWCFCPVFLRCLSALLYSRPYVDTHVILPRHLPPRARARSPRSSRVCGCTGAAEWREARRQLELPEGRDETHQLTAIDETRVSDALPEEPVRSDVEDARAESFIAAGGGGGDNVEGGGEVGGGGRAVNDIVDEKHQDAARGSGRAGPQKQQQPLYPVLDDGPNEQACSFLIAAGLEEWVRGAGGREVCVRETERESARERTREGPFVRAYDVWQSHCVFCVYTHACTCAAKPSHVYTCMHAGASASARAHVFACLRAHAHAHACICASRALACRYIASSHVYSSACMHVCSCLRILCSCGAGSCARVRPDGRAQDFHGKARSRE